VPAMSEPLDIDAIVASDAPAFNGVQFDSKPAALRQLLIVSEVIESVESHANNAADRVIQASRLPPGGPRWRIAPRSGARAEVVVFVEEIVHNDAASRRPPWNRACARRLA
jgi:hypothetical protein